MTHETEEHLRQHLLRSDGQEDVCFATYALSSGDDRDTCLLRDVVLPGPTDRKVHGNATIFSEYAIRAANDAAARGLGLALLHSHPGGRGWQSLSTDDHMTEQDYARLAMAATGLPLLGMTLAGGDGRWSARLWPDGVPVFAEAIRVVGPKLTISRCPDLRPSEIALPPSSRTLAAWGPEVQKDVAGLRVLVVGLGSVGLRVAECVAATGVHHIGLMDFDVVKRENRDRMIGTTWVDALLHRAKRKVARRLTRRACISRKQRVVDYELSISTAEGTSAALDYDVIFSCVDRPLPRAVLNAIAYADLIPVIDGGIAIDRFEAGEMRSATWRAQTATPGRPCLQCSKQITANEVSNDQAGTYDDPGYVRAGESESGVSPNVATLSAGVIGAVLAHFVSLVAHPAGPGVPYPQQFMLPGHQEIELISETDPGCTYERMTAFGESRLPLSAPLDARGRRSA
ncbi:MAG: ThiF family adenylyltransferase [Solirubrobacterales bacterium]